MPVPKSVAVLVGLLIAVAIIPVATIAFTPPASRPAIASAATARRSDPGLPSPLQFKARDGTRLRYYAYPADPDKVAVLVHGSVFPGPSMHALAQSLRNAGVTTYALDTRGHGGSGRPGDIDYVGQIDDDLADFVAQLGPAKKGETRTLVGFSAGAGFAVRFAGGAYGLRFDRYVFLSPILPGSPTLRPASGGWVSVSIPRIVTITALDRVGIHLFDRFSVVSYAVAPELSGSVTSSYSYRLAANFGTGSQYETYLENIRRPAAILVGSADEQELPGRFAPMLQRIGVNIPVTVLPDMKHGDMISAPSALRAVVEAILSPQRSQP